MDVASTTSAQSSTTSTSTTKSTTSSGMADYNTFLQLLIAQAKNQDPTNPTDPAQYVQQFAALSQVEQSVSTNSKLDQIIASLDSLKTTTTAT
ncbi:flagellar hook capping FlgD N-terminal domain-containing protein [Bosea sp. 685]|uniref:flagellar hook capping FlgD N-terminal domain-containing protein n=1 Tax=Bosea sp. 685 TaxID=3080057 RepID=UPI002892DC9D|nr:flagellar hook capping FlgD N-terminal domain-containing protein [Bosea sp. 685]WNJ91312.1 flagellar hook capping FlgD N-terminal domain-containing protein [Bosea sp. 685]